MRLAVLRELVLLLEAVLWELVRTLLHSFAGGGSAGGGSAGAGTPPGSCSLEAVLWELVHTLLHSFAVGGSAGGGSAEQELVLLLEAVLWELVRTLLHSFAASGSAGGGSAGAGTPPGSCSLGAGADPFCLKLFC